MKAKVIEDADDVTYVVVCDPGDEAFDALTQFARDQDLEAAQITAVGAFSGATVGWFDRATKQYRRIPVDEQCEVLSLIGDVAEGDDGPSVHVHVVLGLSDGTTRGGHLLEGRVFPTLEVIIREAPAELRKVMNPDIGIALIDLDRSESRRKENRTMTDTDTHTDTEAPKILDLPIGLDATGMRREFDSLGDVEVPANRYWGAQTQRSLEHFNIGHDRMPKEVYHAYGYVKKAAAVVNTAAGRLPAWKGQLIERVCDEVISGKLDADFPLYVWQTGSGTQSNMNVNEVISNRCIQLVGGTLGSQEPVHPNDHVNMGQSSNDTFPTAMHIAPYAMATSKTIPALKRLRDAIDANSKKWADVVKIGRTHLEDATPLTVGQEWSGYVGALDDAIEETEHATAGLLKVAMGGTAVGTGLNAPPGFGDQVAAQIAQMTGAPYVTAPNKFTAQGTLDRMMRAHAGLKAAAVTSFKIANDLRWLGSGPRTGIEELIFPANEPGSSIMPGKVNPTQAEAMLMVAIQVIASDVAVTIGGAEGNFELNAFRPILISNYLHSALILADMCDHLRRFMIEGTKLNEAKLTENIDRSVMMVTALSPVIGYDKSAAISYYAIDHDLTLKQAALAKGVSEELFDKVVIPINLTRPGSADIPSNPQAPQAPQAPKGS